MVSDYLSKEWTALCERLAQCAQHLAVSADDTTRLSNQATEFASQSAPVTYVDMLDRYRAATTLAKHWQAQRERASSDRSRSEDYVDEIVEESFPASDPPPYGHAHA